MARSVKCLPPKHEDLCSIPSRHVKVDCDMPAWNSSNGEAETNRCLGTELKG